MRENYSSEWSASDSQKEKRERKFRGNSLIPRYCGYETEKFRSNQSRNQNCKSKNAAAAVATTTTWDNLTTTISRDTKSATKGETETIKAKQQSCQLQEREGVSELHSSTEQGINEILTTNEGLDVLTIVNTPERRVLIWTIIYRSLKIRFPHEVEVFKRLLDKRILESPFKSPKKGRIHVKGE